MILRITVHTANLNINNQTVRVVRVYNRNVPAGITEVEFTQKGGILVGSGVGTFGELAPGLVGQYPTPDPAEPLGVKWVTPTITVNDTTNHLINGGFTFAQRQTPATLTTIADGAYGPDRWKCYRENADLQYRRVDASTEAGLTSPYYGEFKKITNAGKILFFQALEYLDTLKFRGKVIGFQLQMKANSARTMKVAVVELQAAGTSDTLPAAVSAWGADGTDPTLGANLAVIGTPVSCSVTTAMQTFQFTGTFPATSKNLLVMVWSNADFAANDTLGVAEAGLYFGESQRSWTPRHAGLEIEMLRRYYFKTYNIDISPGTVSSAGKVRFTGTGGVYDSASVRLSMRSAPSCNVYSPNTGASSKIYNASSGLDINAYVDSAGEMNASPTVNAIAVTAGNLLYAHITASAEL